RPKPNEWDAFDSGSLQRLPHQLLTQSINSGINRPLRETHMTPIARVELLDSPAQSAVGQRTDAIVDLLQKALVGAALLLRITFKAKVVDDLRRIKRQLNGGT